MISGRVFGGRIFDVQQREKVIIPCVIAFIVAMTLLAFSETLEMFISCGCHRSRGARLSRALVVCLCLDLVGSSRGPAIGWLTAMGIWESGWDR